MLSYRKLEALKATIALLLVGLCLYYIGEPEGRSLVESVYPGRYSSPHVQNLLGDGDMSPCADLHEKLVFLQLSHVFRGYYPAEGGLPPNWGTGTKITQMPHKALLVADAHEHPTRTENSFLHSVGSSVDAVNNPSGKTAVTPCNPTIKDPITVNQSAGSAREFQKEM
jgi:hypothetical protein